MKTFAELVFDALDIYAQMPMAHRQSIFQFLDELELPAETRLAHSLSNALCYVVMTGHDNTLVFPLRRPVEDDDDETINLLETIH
jgi:hypothetical protein